MSRKPSPSKFTPNTVNDKAMPGNSTMCGAIENTVRPSEIILPQLGVEGGVPAPMKLSIASVKTAEANIYVACTIKGARVFGNMCRHNKKIKGVPAVMAAST